MKVITCLDTFRKILNEISSLKPNFVIFSFFGGKIGHFWPYFQPKIENVENYDLKLEISFRIFRKVSRHVITFISYDIATRNHDLMNRSSYVSETAFSCIKIYAFFPLYIFYKSSFVA